MPDSICDYLEPMKAGGFIFEKKQRSHMQNRGWELKFIHPKLVKKLQKKGDKVRGKKFYIKRLSDEPNSEIGLVNGKLTRLNEAIFNSPSNSVDSFDDSPAWANKEKNRALDKLLNSIKNYVNHR